MSEPELRHAQAIELYLNSAKLAEQIERLEGYAERLSDIADALAYVADHLRGNGTVGTWGFDEQVDRTAARAGVQSEYLVIMVNMLLQAMQRYREYEAKARSFDRYGEDGAPGSLDDFLDDTYHPYGLEELTARQSNEAGQTDFFESYGELFYADADGGVKAAYGVGRNKRKEVEGHKAGLTASGEAHAALTRNGYSMCVAGLYCAKGEVRTLAVDVEGHVSATAVHDGKDGATTAGPGIEAGGKIAGDVLRGQTEVTLGTKHFNVGSGFVLNAAGAALEGEVYAGKGGAYWKAKYDTHLIQVKADVRVTVLGVRGQATATVNAGGVNGSLGAGATPTEANAELGFGALAGGEIEVEVNTEGLQEIGGATIKDVRSRRDERSRAKRWGL